MSHISTKNENSKIKKDGVGKFLMDFFMLFSLINGTVCNLSYNPSKDLKIFKDQRVDDDGQFYRVVCQKENLASQNPKELKDLSSAKALNCKFVKNVEREIKRAKFAGKVLTPKIMSKNSVTYKYCVMSSDNLSFRQRSFKFGHRILGQRKRLQFALLPIMYKMGVMTTLLTGLTVLALKGLTIGVILLIFAFGNHFMKSYKIAPELPQPIHVHVHSQDGGLKYHHHHYETDVNTRRSSRIYMNQESPYFSKTGENTTKLLLNQANKLKAIQFYH